MEVTSIYNFKMKITFSTILLLLLSITVMAQTPEKELDKVITKYKNLESYSINAHYYIYTSHTDIKPTEEAFGVYQKKGNKLRVKQYGTEFIQNDKYLVVKDDSTETIVLTMAQKEQNVALDMKQILAYYSKIETIKSKKNGQKSFRVFFKEGVNTEYQKADVYINGETYFLDEVVLYYTKIYDVSNNTNKTNYQRPKMRIVYTKIDINPVFAQEIFDVSKYITLNKAGKNILKSKYSSYEFYDQTQ